MADSDYDSLDMETLQFCLRICDAALEDFKGERTKKIRREIADAIQRKRIDPARGMRLSGADGKKYGY